MATEIYGFMTRNKVAIIDYGMGNIWSVISALNYLNCEVTVTSNPLDVLKNETLLLPGVGSFRRAMTSLRQLGLDKAIEESLQNPSHVILGICLGMQLLGKSSNEDGFSTGLNLIPTEVEVFSSKEVGANKIPHIGFDQVIYPGDSELFRGLPENPDFYFVHSYRMLHSGLEGKSTLCNYKSDFLAAYEYENIFATQFHPEKSQTNGLKLLRNFLAV